MNRELIRVSFTPEEIQFLASCVASGRYPSMDDAVRDAVRRLEDDQAISPEETQRCRRLIQEGIDNIDRGDVIDAKTFFAEWDVRLAEHRARPTGAE